LLLLIKKYTNQNPASYGKHFNQKKKEDITKNFLRRPPEL